MGTKTHFFKLKYLFYFQEGPPTQNNLSQNFALYLQDYCVRIDNH
jgi:hypothetical protein